MESEGSCRQSAGLMNRNQLRGGHDGQEGRKHNSQSLACAVGSYASVDAGPRAMPEAVMKRALAHDFGPSSDACCFIHKFINRLVQKSTDPFNASAPPSPATLLRDLTPSDSMGPGPKPPQTAPGLLNIFYHFLTRFRDLTVLRANSA